MHTYVHTQYFSTYLHTYLPAYTPPYCLHICTACTRVYISVSAEPPWQYVHEGHTSMNEFCEDALALSMRIQIKIIKIKLCKCFLRWPYDSCLLWFCCWHRKSFALVGYPVRLSAGSFHYRSTSRLEITSFKIDVSNVEIQKYVDHLNQLLFD